MGAITIRPMSEDDYDAALRLWQACEGVTLRTADGPEAIARFLRRNPGLSFVAIADVGLVGTILAGHDGRRGYIHHTAVAPGHRGGGCARAMVEAALAALAGQGLSKAHVHVLQSNIHGQGFWQALGWEPRAELLVMSRNMSDDPNA